MKNNHVRSGIYLEGAAMRYAEIEHSKAGRKLLRLGTCDFEFDVERAIYSESPEHVTTIKSALSDVFSGTRSKNFSLVVPASACVAFYSPVSSSMAESDRLRHLASEAMLVAGSTQTMAVTAEFVGTEPLEDEEVAWHHVAAIRQSKWDHVSEVLSVLRNARFHYLTRLQSAAAVALRGARRSELQGGSPGVVVGRFDDVTEVGIIKDARLCASKMAPVTDAADVCYHLLAELQDAGIAQDAVDEVQLYGKPDPELDREVSRLLSLATTRLNPLSIVSNPPPAVDFDPGQYVLCVGGAL